MDLVNDAPAGAVAICWFVFVVTWIVAALFTKRTVERSWGWMRLSTLILGALIWWTVNDPRTRALRRLWTPSPATEWPAALVVALGLGVALWSRFALGRNWSGAVTFKQDHELIERGPYRFVRHPIYTGLLLMAFGTALLRARIAGFVICGIITIGLWFKLRAEERLLTRHFPEAYPEYRRRVRALIPFVL